MGVLEGGMVKEGETGDVSKFLNRILGLKVHQQNLVRGCGRGVVSRTVLIFMKPRTTNLHIVSVVLLFIGTKKKQNG